MDATQLREATRRWVTGAGVVTTAADGEKHGALVNNVACVSTDPPVYLACLGNASRTLAAVLASRAFNIHFLASGQKDVATAFAARDGDKFASVSHQAGLLGAPVLDGTVVCLECELQATHDAGGSTVVFGRVLAAHVHAREPLAMRGWDFVTIAPGP